MILDKETLIADGLAFGVASSVLDLGVVKPGPGQPKKLFVQGSAACDITTLTITDGATSAAADAFMVRTVDLAGKRIEIDLPSDVARYLKITPSGGSTGTWSAGLVLPGVQTNT